MPREPADVLDAWIRDLLGDVQGARVQRLMQLCSQLQAAIFDWDNGPIAQALSDLSFAGRDLSFLPLHRNWFVRLLGRHRAAHAAFLARHARMVDCVAPVKQQTAQLADREDGAPAARGTLSAIEAEREAFNAAIDQAVTWLQDMCTQLAQARESGSDDPKLDTLAESAQLHTQELKRLQTAATIAHDIAVRGRSVLDRRAALLEQVRVEMREFDAHWMARLGELVAVMRAGRNAIPAIPKAIEAHNDFMKRLAASVDACGALQHEERLLAQHLAMLQEDLQQQRH